MLKKKNKQPKGFTLIEIMLVVALIVVIGGISMPIYQSFQVKNDLDVATYSIAQTLRRAQILSQTGEGDSVWGVHLENGKVILFRGADFVARDSSVDEILEISKDIFFTGINEVFYSKLLGEPGQTGNITLTTSTGETKTLRINKKGMIEY